MPRKAAPKGKGKGLKKKVGPFPAYVWVIGGIVVVLGYLYYRRRNQAASGSAPGSQNQTVIPSGVVQPVSSGSSTDQSVPDSTGTTTYPTDYATETDLATAIQSINDSTAAAIAGITFPQPNVNITVPPAQVAQTTTASKTAAKKSAATTAKKAPARIRYYTKKSQVHLKAGQKLHFTRGKGYYAA